MDISPNGPLMCTVTIAFCWSTASRFRLPITGGRTSNDTPGGIERGAFPIFEDFCGEVEKLRLWTKEEGEAIGNCAGVLAFAEYDFNVYSRQRHRARGNIVVVNEELKSWQRDKVEFAKRRSRGDEATKLGTTITEGRDRSSNLYREDSVSTRYCCQTFLVHFLCYVDQPQ